MISILGAVQSLSHVQLFATPWTASCQASPSFTISWSLLKLRRKWQPTPVFLPGESQGEGEPGGLPSMGLHRVGHA